jgi:hypothetical protein
MQGFITRKWENFEKHILAPHTVRLQMMMPHEESVQNLCHPWENDEVCNTHVLTLVNSTMLQNKHVLKMVQN